MIDYTVFFCPKGSAYKSVKPHSHYSDPIDHSPGRPAGNSRIWGDASQEVQQAVIEILIRKGQEQSLSTRETAHVLAICRVESGFNPDAAAGTTSASGLGQFIDDTGRAYGLSDSNRFDLEANADALIRHLLKNKALAAKRGFTGRAAEEMIYRYHHDGPSKDFGGLALSQEKVMPLVDRFEKALGAPLAA